jgi:hypothetical protein
VATARSVYMLVVGWHKPVYGPAAPRSSRRGTHTQAAGLAQREAGSLVPHPRKTPTPTNSERGGYVRGVLSPSLRGAVELAARRKLRPISGPKGLIAAPKPGKGFVTVMYVETLFVPCPGC